MLEGIFIVLVIFLFVVGFMWGLFSLLHGTWKKLLYPSDSHRIKFNSSNECYEIIRTFVSKNDWSDYHVESEIVFSSKEESDVLLKISEIEENVRRAQQLNKSLNQYKELK